MDEHKYLISSPAEFIGEYQNSSFSIKGVIDSFIWNSNRYAETSQYYYILKLYFKNEWDGRIKRIPKENGDIICWLLSSYFGKVFYYHGLIQSEDMDFIPNIYKPKNDYYMLFPYNNDGDDKNLMYLPNFDNIFQKEKNEILISATNYYTTALRIHHDNPDMSYLNLVATGEILSNLINYDENELYDKSILRMFDAIIKDMDDSEKYIKQLKSLLRSIKKKYCLYILKTIDNDFYVTNDDHWRIKRENIESCVKASYDLRSQYVHSGRRFGKLTALQDNEREIGNYISRSNNKEFDKLIDKAPTFLGINRIIQYCLRKEIRDYST